MQFPQFTVVRVPFPFADRAAVKHRPALVLSSAEFGTAAGHSVMAMITSASRLPWPEDVVIADLSSAGLPAPSKVRFKLFTLDHTLVEGVLGQLAPADVLAVRAAMARVMP